MQEKVQHGPKLLTNAGREHFFGAFPFRPAPTPSNHERIEMLDDWAKHHIVQVVVPGILVSSPNTAVRAWVHKLVAPHLIALFEAWQEAELSDRILAWNGAYAPRFKRGRAPAAPLPNEPYSAIARSDLVSRLSAHSWGSAVDLNAHWNPLGHEPAPIGSEGSVLELVPIAEKLGWSWGGRWSSRKDAMHFEAPNP